MASGLGRRFGGNKLLAEFDGAPMICRILDATDGIFARRVVVTRHEEVAELCKERGIDVILHAFPGRNDTVRLGLEAVSEGMERCMFCPSDQPLLKKGTILSMLEAAEQDKNRILRLACGEMEGAPVIFPAWCFSELKVLPEGKGGGVLLRRYPERVGHVKTDDPLELRDVDTRENLALLSAYLTDGSLQK